MKTIKHPETEMSTQTPLSELHKIFNDKTKTVKDLIIFLDTCPNAENFLITASEAAEILGVSRSQIYKLFRNGHLKGFKIKNLYWRTKIVYIEEYLQNIRLPNSKATRFPLTFLDGGCI